MRIWLITVGEPLPIDSGNPRLHRAGILSELLAAQGHDVVWWTSTFDHFRKVHRYHDDTHISINDRLDLILLHSTGYRRNVSLSRIIDHYGVARKFDKLSKAEKQPDIILCSLPTLELCQSAAEYGRKHRVPVVLDVRDLWPDIFAELVPNRARGLAKILLFPLYRTARIACRNATAIIGTTPAFVDWGLRLGCRHQSEWDRDFPMAYSESVPNAADISAAQHRWAKHGVRRNDFNVCFFGTIGRQFDLETVIAAAKKLEGQGRSFRFILCGDGERLSLYRNQSTGCSSIIFPGWVNQADIWTLMRMCRIGLAPYYSIPNFTMNLPNKPFEYLSAGLPIVSSLQGILKDLLVTHQCGVTYANGDFEELASILTQLYDDPKRLEAMSHRALAVYQEKFTVSKVYSDMINHLDRLSKFARTT